VKTIFYELIKPLAIAACLISSSQVAQSQTAEKAMRSELVVNYRSPIADYKPYVDEKIISWKAANDKVGQIGGWRAYAKEAQQALDSKTEATTTNPHAGHHK